ncbi:MAG: hypothetical protein HYW63_04210 [Candidatus Levybacteria bacterium]|nr:hypothetical protein [Candidatus Levybacteria bacterium]
MPEPQAPEDPQKDREPRVLDDQGVREAQQDALVIFAQRFTGTPLEPVFTDEEFTGTREYNSAMGRNYRATRTANGYGDEILFQAFIKRSDTGKGVFLGDEIRLRRPSTLGTVREFDHVIHETTQTRRTAPPNTDINRDSGLDALRNLPRPK